MIKMAALFNFSTPNNTNYSGLQVDSKVASTFLILLVLLSVEKIETINWKRLLRKPSLYIHSWDCVLEFSRRY
jgi:hypothetical protein